MTDNEIIKALEGLTSGCFDCNDGCKQSSECPVNIISCALDLINRLQVKNKELDEKLIIQKGLIDTQQAEIERLESEYPCKVKCGNNCEIWAKSLSDYDNLIGDISAEGIKEFAKKVETELDERVSENIRNRNPHWYIAKRIVRETAIEMTEGCENG